MARDQVSVDCQAQQAQAVLEVVLPELGVPVEELLAAPDVVHEDVEAAVALVDTRDESCDLIGLEVVDRDRDPLAARGVDERGGLLDRLGAVVLGALLPGRATGAVDGCARLSQRDRRAAPGSAGRTRDQRDLARQIGMHAPDAAAPKLQER